MTISDSILQPVSMRATGYRFPHKNCVPSQAVKCSTMISGWQKHADPATADRHIKKLVRKPLIGSVEQFSDSTDILSNPEWRAGIRNLYCVESIE